MTTALAAPRADLKVGGNYRARDNGDGTFDILDVPVFCEIPAGAKRNKSAIGREWQVAAVAQNRAREAGGHLPPVHVYHSDEVAVKPVYAGKMRLNAVRQTNYEGKTVWATFADILGMPGEVFTKVKRGFLPYRSVEIHNWTSPEIDSLALMDTDVPFFRMPMLTVGEITLQKDADMILDANRPAAVACRSSKKGESLVLFRFKDEDEDPAEVKKDASEGALDAPPAAGETKAASVADLDEKPDGPPKKGPGGAEMEAAGETKPDVEKPEAILGEGGEHKDAGQDSALIDTKIQKAVAPVLAMCQSLGNAIKALMDRIGPSNQQTPEKTDPVNGLNLAAEAQGEDFSIEKEIAMADPKAPEPKAEQKVTFGSKEEFQSFLAASVKEAVLTATGPMLAKVTEMETKTKAAEKAASIEARFTAAKKEFADAGQEMPENVEKHLRSCAETMSDDAWKAQVESFRSVLPTAPPTDGAAFERSLLAKQTSLAADDEVNKFCAKHGAHRAAWAKKQIASFRQAREAGWTDETSAEEWLETNLRADTMFERNAV